MAVMYPADIEEYEEASEGEKRVFRFLKEAARPHKDYICWYEPPIGSEGKEPDFVLFSKSLGLLVLEVKDWTSQQIISYSPHTFTILIGGKKEERTNPDKQAKGYVNRLNEKLKEFPEFLSDDPKYSGNPRIPIGRMVVFSNISKEEYSDSKFKWLLDSERFLSGDDLDATGEFLCDASGRKFRERISKVFPFPFQGLHQKEVDKLCFIIWPEGQIDLPARAGSGKTRFQREVLALDESQARVALRLGKGHQIIKGPPGSGKTLVLIHRCYHLFKYSPKAKRILLVCYNIALLGYLKRLIQEKGLRIGEKGIAVYHFYELCSRILNEPVHYENEDSEYYDLVTQEALENLKNGKSRIAPFDAILIDEGQDFQEEMLMVLLELLKPEGDLVIGLDSYQDLYRRKFSWKSVGIRVSGRTRHLKTVYRNTLEIFDSTQRFIGEIPGMGRQPSTLPFDFAFHGDLPEFHQFANLEEVQDFLIDDLKRCVGSEDCKRSEIAIIYDDKIYGPSRFTYDNRALPMRILNKLETSGIPAFWVSQDARSKEMYDITTDRVSLISVHSSKGLDFDLVYLIGIDHIASTEETKEALNSLVYVAMTRAKYRLVIPYIEETELIKRMKDCILNG
ncbi:MAG: NERD domain-containing protein [Deltaproteobacteria bacterium]|nr:NERD domain-containing protein [Deltaproteobacteria bacterium]